MNLQSCDLCPRRCGVNRAAGGRGYCGAGSLVRIALVSLHRWEEPCLTGERGAGTVFFSYCNMKCIFCQNFDISHKGKGIDVTVPRLVEIFLEQQARGAASLDLVTPTHYVPQIVEALDSAKKQGFSLPVVYNCGGYELPETIEALRGYVDIFLPDLKYCDNTLALRYSNAPEYFRYACASIEKMFELTGPFKMNGKRMVSGVLVRHLVLPGQYRDSLKILDYLKGTFGNSIYVSLMNQYTPMPQASCFPEINRRLTTYEYEKVLEHAEKLGLTNCYIQYGRTASEKFIPKFDGTNVLKSKEQF
jgi:putative pyruvate formate lyase activating enzyme